MAENEKLDRNIKQAKVAWDIALHGKPGDLTQPPQPREPQYPAGGVAPGDTP
jgi:hypothetical protein